MCSIWEKENENETAHNIKLGYNVHMDVRALPMFNCIWLINLESNAKSNWPIPSFRKWGMEN